MSVILKIKNEIDSFSKWFKILLVILFGIYLSFWIFTIHLSNIQKTSQIGPVLPVLAEDSEGYARLAQSIISGNGFSQNGRTETLRTPGYPFFVALIKTIGQSYFVVTFFQILLVFISSLIIRRIGIIFSSKKVGELASFLFLINPVTLALSLVILTDTLFLFLFILGFYLTISISDDKFIPKLIAVSTIFSMAIYMRMGLFGFPLLIIPILATNLTSKNKIKSMAILAVILLFATLPWFVRNYIQTGVFGFTSFKAVNLAWVTPRFLANTNHSDLGLEEKRFGEVVGIPESNWQDIRFSDHISSVAEKIILEKPFSYLKFHLITSIAFLFPSSLDFALTIYHSAIHYKVPFRLGSINALASGDFKAFFEGIMRVWWKVLERLCWFLLYIVALFGIWDNRKRLITWAFVFVIAYFLLLAGPASGPRYTFQAFPFIFILSISGVVYLWHKFLKKHEV